jgi:hypothetical protein
MLYELQSALRKMQREMIGWLFEKMHVGGGLDFLFIGGDYALARMLADCEMYSPRMNLGPHRCVLQ